MFWLRNKKNINWYALSTKGLMNIGKTLKNKEASLKHKQVDFTPIGSLLHAVLSSQLASLFIQWSFLNIEALEGFLGIQGYWPKT